MPGSFIRPLRTSIHRSGNFEVWWKILTGVALVGSFSITQLQIYKHDRHEETQRKYELAKAEVKKLEDDYALLCSTTSSVALRAGAKTPLRDTAVQLCRRTYDDKAVTDACRLWLTELTQAEVKDPDNKISGSRDILVTALSSHLEETCRKAIKARYAAVEEERNKAW